MGGGREKLKNEMINTFITNRITSTGRVWPSRCTLSMAWSSTAGFHHGSILNKKLMQCNCINLFIILGGGEGERKAKKKRTISGNIHDIKERKYTTITDRGKEKARQRSKKCTWPISRKWSLPPRKKRKKKKKKSERVRKQNAPTSAPRGARRAHWSIMETAVPRGCTRGVGAKCHRKFTQKFKEIFIGRKG